MEVSASGFVKELEEMENDYLQEYEDEEAPEDDEKDPVDPESHEKEDTDTAAMPQQIEAENQPSVEQDPPVVGNIPESQLENLSTLSLAGDAEDQLPEMMEDWSGIKTVRSRAGAGSATSMSTIHPDIVKQRVKKTINRRENAQALQRIRAKGEASAATRKKRENKDLIRADGIWGWDN